MAKKLFFKNESQIREGGPRFLNSLWNFGHHSFWINKKLLSPFELRSRNAVKRVMRSFMFILDAMIPKILQEVLWILSYVIFMFQMWMIYCFGVMCLFYFGVHRSWLGNGDGPKMVPKGIKMANLSVFDHSEPFWAHLDPFVPFQTKIRFLLRSTAPKPYFVHLVTAKPLCQSCSAVNNRCVIYLVCTGW